MGLGGISPGSLLLIFLIVVLLFGTKKLASLGEDLGKAIQGFKKGLKEAQNESYSESKEASHLNNTSSSNTTPSNQKPLHQSQTDSSSESPHDS